MFIINNFFTKISLKIILIQYSQALFFILRCNVKSKSYKNVCFKPRYNFPQKYRKIRKVETSARTANSFLDRHP